LPANIVIFSHFTYHKTQKNYLLTLFYSFYMGYNGVMVGQIDVFVYVGAVTLPIVGMEDVVYSHPDGTVLIGKPGTVTGLGVGVGQKVGHSAVGV
jgi:hypothetical protein